MLSQRGLWKRRLVLGSISLTGFHYLIWKHVPRVGRTENKVTSLTLEEEGIFQLEKQSFSTMAPGKATSVKAGTQAQWSSSRATLPCGPASSPSPPLAPPKAMPDFKIFKNILLCRKCLFLPILCKGWINGSLKNKPNTRHVPWCPPFPDAMVWMPFVPETHVELRLPQGQCSVEGPSGAGGVIHATWGLRMGEFLLSLVWISYHDTRAGC